MRQLDPSADEYKAIVGQFDKTWNIGGDAGNFPKPTIAAIWDIHNEALTARFQSYCWKKRGVAVWSQGGLGNQQKRFHGTKMKCKFAGSPCSDTTCAICGIIQNGFDMKRCKTGFFGRGIYCTSASTAAVRYAKTGMKVDGAVFLVGVACGKAEVMQGVDIKDKQLNNKPGCPAGFDSRIVNKPHDAQIYIDHANQYGVPILKCDNEIIVFQDDAIVPKNLIIFS